MQDRVTGQQCAREQLFVGICVVRYAAEVLHNGLVELCAAPSGHPADEHDVAAQPGMLCFYTPAQETGLLSIFCVASGVALHAFVQVTESRRDSCQDCS